MEKKKLSEAKIAGLVLQKQCWIGFVVIVGLVLCAFFVKSMIELSKIAELNVILNILVMQQLFLIILTVLVSIFAISLIVNGDE